MFSLSASNKIIYNIHFSFILYSVRLFIINVLAQQPQGHLTETAIEHKENAKNSNNKRKHKEKGNKNDT
jgi:hypothetical protein